MEKLCVECWSPTVHFNSLAKVWAHSVTPADQMSTLNPEKVSSPLAISGGWKAGEPWLVRHVSSSAKGWRAWKTEPTVMPIEQTNQGRTCRWRQPGLTSATPRSEILSAPSVVSSRFPGLMSLWTIPWLCKYSRPSRSWQKYLETWGDSHWGLCFQDCLDIHFCRAPAAVECLNLGLEESLHRGPN